MIALRSKRFISGKILLRSLGALVAQFERDSAGSIPKAFGLLEPLRGCAYGLSKLLTQFVEPLGSNPVDEKSHNVGRAFNRRYFYFCVLVRL